MLTAPGCGKSLNEGDIYLKQSLDFHGSAEEIFLRSDLLIERIIEHIVQKDQKLNLRRVKQCFSADGIQPRAICLTVKRVN